MSNNHDYDVLIKTAAQELLPAEIDWRLIKAQLLAESNLEEKARSSVGAVGIAQFMPSTWDQVKHQMGLPPHATCDKARYAIPGCCFYMCQLWDAWQEPRPIIDRFCLAAASYNAGLGNLVKAQAEAGGARAYAAIASKLFMITGTVNSKQTLDYVRKILNYWVVLIVDSRL